MRENRNLRVVLAVEYDHRFRVLETGALPCTHVREGESLHYAAGSIARSLGLTIRVAGISAVVERENARFGGRTIDVYVLARATDGALRDGSWRFARELAQAGMAPELAHSLEGGHVAPYLGKIADETPP